MSWYPLGRPVGTTIYPGMQITAVAIWRALGKRELALTPEDKALMRSLLTVDPTRRMTVDAALDWFNSVPDASVAKTTDAVKAAMDGLDPATCDLIPLPSTESWEAFAAKATAGADAGKLRTFADRAAPVVAALKRADGDRVCLPPVAKLEAAALAQADAARARVEINQ